MSQDSYRPPTPARPRPMAPPPPNMDRPRPSLLIALPGGVTCRSWDDFLAVSSQRWEELRDHLVAGRLGASVARAGYPERVPDPDSRATPDERLDDWLESLPTARKALPELDVQPGRIEIDASASPETVRLRIANVGYRLLRFRVEIEPLDADWLVLPPWADGLEVVTVEGITIDLAVNPPRKANRARSATLRIISNGGECLVPVSLRIAAASVRSADASPSRGAWGPLIGAALGLAGHPLAMLVGRLFPGLSPFPSTGLALGLLGLAVGVWIVGVKAGPIDRLAGGLAGAFAGLLAADVAIMAAEAMPAAPWWLSMIVWSLLGALAAVATGPSIPRSRGAAP